MNGTSRPEPLTGDRNRGFGFPRRRRIRQGSEIRALLRSGRRVRAGALEVVVAPGGAGEARFGTIVPLYGGTAVRRNRMKRRLREIARQDVLPRLDAMDVTVDFLVRIRPGAYHLSFAALRSSLIRITEQLCSDQ